MVSSVWRGERGKEEASVLTSWTALTILHKPMADDNTHLFTSGSRGPKSSKGLARLCSL